MFDSPKLAATVDTNPSRDHSMDDPSSDPDEGGNIDRVECNSSGDEGQRTSCAQSQNQDEQMKTGPEPDAMDRMMPEVSTRATPPQHVVVRVWCTPLSNDRHSLLHVIVSPSRLGFRCN